MMVAFHPNFEILPGTAPKAPSAAPKPFEVPDRCRRTRQAIDSLR